jgi:WD40 repeat protein
MGTPLAPHGSAITLENAPLVSGLAEWRELTVTDLAWTPDGLLLAVANQIGINLYSILDRRVLRALYPRNEGIVDIEFSPGGSWLIAGSRQGDEKSGYTSSLEMWTGADLKPLGIIYGVDQALSGMAFSPNGRLFATAYTSPVYDHNNVEMWNIPAWSIISPTLKTGTILGLTFAPSGDLLATTPDRYAIRVWDLANYEWLYTLHTSFTGAVTRIAFSPDGQTLASGHYDGRIQLWDMRTGESFLVIETPEVIESLTFSPDGRLLASGGSFENSLVRLWSAGSGDLLRTLEGHTKGVGHLLFSPNGNYLVSASYDGSIRLWGIRP